MAEQVGKNEATVSRWCSNKMQPSLDMLVRIAELFRLLDNTVGVEVNFNKEFYVPETVESVDSILAEIAEIDKELINLEKELGL